MKDDDISRQAAIELAIQYCTDDDGSCSKADRDIRELLDDLENLPSAQPEQQHGRMFQEIVVEYPSISTYPEYRGKPYFSIKYTENGQGFIGYGTYKPEVLSEYLKEYFMPYVQPKRTGKRTETHACDLIDRQAAIDVLCELMHHWFGEDSKDEVREIKRELEKLPSAQPEIIRCKDCKWCEDADGSMCKNPASWVVATDRDFGCVLAERREYGSD